MKTEVYLIRHSEPFKVHRGSINTNESVLLENEKSPLSVNGEKMAEQYSKKEIFTKIDVVYSSNYVRAMATAKYFAVNNNLKVNIDERFNERIHGVNSWDELPKNFEIEQFVNENYKVGFGESQKEVQDRMFKALNELMEEYPGKTIAVISHSTAIAFLLKKFGHVEYAGNYSFDNNVYFDGNWNYLETFKLEFNDKEIISITNIK